MSKLREKIFRGKRVDNGEWVEGYLLQENLIVPAEQPFSFCKYNDRNIITSDSYLVFYEVVPNTVGEYTNLTDENYKKIFEGDIVRFIDCTSTENGHSEQYCDGEVIWCKETLSFEVTNRLSAESYEVLTECVIIGNIHDNPEREELKKED